MTATPWWRSTALRHAHARYVHHCNAEADDPLIWYDAGTARWLHADHQGSIVAVTNGAGGSLTINAYDEWGIPNGTNVGRFQYTGQAWLSELGMYHYKARIYSPTLGRFLQTDPVGYEDQINLYAYVGSDPVGHTDPSGEEMEVARNGNNIHLTVRIAYYGAGATREVQARFDQAIRNYWGGDFGRYAVTITVHSRVLPGPPSVGLIASNRHWNFVQVPTGDGRANVRSNRFGYWPTKRSNWTIAHETGHFGRLRDRYDSDGTPHPGYERDIMGARGMRPTERSIADLLRANSGNQGAGREPPSAPGTRIGCPRHVSGC